MAGYFVGFSLRGSTDSESIKSPASPLDFSLFSSLSSQFSLKFPKSPTQNGNNRHKWSCSKVGLGIVNLLVDETKSTGVVLSSPKRKNIIFGSEVKTDYSKSFPADYMLVLLSQTESHSSPLNDAVSEKAGVSFETETFQNSSSISLSPQNTQLSSKKFCSENRTTTTATTTVSSSSLPVPISSLSAREIELSEDYTCIISYGPNPKTTHVFGDCILECHTSELPDFNKTENLMSELSREADCLDVLASFPSEEFLSFCCSCKKKLEEGDDIYIYGGEKAFCSFDCRSEETGKTCYDSLKNSPESSYHEDVFSTYMGC